MTDWPLPLVVIGWIWAFPCTLISWLLCVDSYCYRYEGRGAFAFIAGSGWSWILDKLGQDAITLSAVIVYRRKRNAESTRLVLHELRHAGQAYCLGPLWWPAYGIASSWAWLRGRKPYDNVFEAWARGE